jgi:hypothetical protein
MPNIQIVKDEELSSTLPIGTWFQLPPNYTHQLYKALLVVGEPVFQIYNYVGKNGSVLQSKSIYLDVLVYNLDGTREHIPQFWLHKLEDVRKVPNPFDANLQLMSDLYHLNRRM